MSFRNFHEKSLVGSTDTRGKSEKRIFENYVKRPFTKCGTMKSKRKLLNFDKSGLKTSTKSVIFRKIETSCIRKMLAKNIMQIIYFFHPPCPLNILWLDLGSKTKKSGGNLSNLRSDVKENDQVYENCDQIGYFQHFLDSVLRVEYDTSC